MTASLKQRLIWILLGLTLFAWITSAVATFAYSRGAMLQQVDRQLEQYADLVIYISRVFARQIDEGLPLYESWITHDLDRAREEPMVIEGPMADGLTPAVNIWLGGNLIAVVAGSPRFEKPGAAGFSSLDTDGGDKQWRLYSRYDETSEVWIRVGIELGIARAAMLSSLGRALMPLLIVLPLTIAVLYFGVTRGLAPLRSLAEQIARRSPGSLDPLGPEEIPSEVAPVVSSVNTLLQRLALALEGEQRFTANAAHELMTPLAAIKTEVQLCQRQLRGEPGAAMLERIAQRVDRASHTVEQLLTLARVDPEAPLVPVPVALRSLLVEVLADTAHLAVERGLQVELAEGDDIPVSGNEEALAILLRNLLVNAFRYASENSAVSVLLEEGERPKLEIRNDCAPLSPAEFSRIRDRFYRVPGSRGLGAGLGLSIASRIAQLHGAELETGPGPGGSGFCATVRFE